MRLRPAGADNVRCGECGKRPKTARPGRLHRGPAGALTVRSMNLTEERYLPGGEALLHGGYARPFRTGRDYNLFDLSKIQNAFSVLLDGDERDALRHRR